MDAHQREPMNWTPNRGSLNEVDYRVCQDGLFLSLRSTLFCVPCTDSTVTKKRWREMGGGEGNGEPTMAWVLSFAFFIAITIIIYVPLVFLCPSLLCLFVCPRPGEKSSETGLASGFGFAVRLSRRNT